jgi:predicted Ser/Thr protein kinase
MLSRLPKGGGEMDETNGRKSAVMELFARAADNVRAEYEARRRAMSFSEYLGIFAEKPRLGLRDAARYLLDAIDYFGAVRSTHPWGDVTRYRIFDQAFEGGGPRLVGQEKVQGAVRAALESQVRDGAINRLILVHGPNGSAKSTLVSCLCNGAEHYSRLPEGELYRFRWIFPSRNTASSSIGFGGRMKRDSLETFAHLEDDEIDATLECEVRDHPLLLLPRDERVALMQRALDDAGMRDYQIPDYFFRASLCHRCRQVADALTRTHKGDLKKVLAHVQVEPWALSRRYRRGLVEVGPQLTVDAGQRQVTADRNLGALPIELQNMTLFETFGPVIDAAGGILSFEDMLKRPLDAYKYLLTSIESGELMIGQMILKMNMVLVGTTNDVMLEAFREHHEYQSFRERLTLVPAPYMKRRSDEASIYELHLKPHFTKHVAPHAIEIAAHFAVLTRLHKPDPAVYPDSLKIVMSRLTAAEKCELYDQGHVPDGLKDDVAAELVDSIEAIGGEDAATWQYEGRYGASPRVIRSVLLSASMSEGFDCVSPFAVLEELRQLCGRTREYNFLERGKEDGGYHDHRGFVDVAEKRLFDQLEREIQGASGLVEEHRHEELLERYVTHVRHVVKKEKIHNPGTNADEDPDESLMRSVEEALDVSPSDKDEYRRSVMSRIAAWAIEHPGQKLLLAAVLPGQLRSLRDSYFEKHRQKVAAVARHALRALDAAKTETGLDAESAAAGERLVGELIARYGYCRSCARDGVARLLASRFGDD